MTTTRMWVAMLRRYATGLGPLSYGSVRGFCQPRKQDTFPKVQQHPVAAVRASGAKARKTLFPLYQLVSG